MAVGSYPRFTDPRYKVRVTIESKNGAEVAAALDYLKTLVPAETIVPPPPAA